MYRFGLAFLMGGVLLVAACGGGGGSGGSGSGGSGGGNASTSITSVAVTCSPSTMVSDQISICSAVVSGTGDFSSAVTWSASAGSVNSAGVFTAPPVESTGSVTITATSAQDNTKAGSVMVTVNPLAAGNNVLPIVVDGGPTGDYINAAFTRVKVCVPGSTTDCQTIDHVLVDTGAVGLRLLSTAGGGEFSLSLPQQQAPDGNPLVECARFLDGFTWGPVALADIYLGGEVAGSTRIQVIAPAGVPSVPSSCSSAGRSKSTLSQLGANGILGIGLFLQDCGDYCSQNLLYNFYYSCPSTGCVETLIPTAQQLQNPVSMFANDNNGVIIELPAIPDTGQAAVNGWLVFGIGTQPNNGLGGAVVYTTDAVGSFTATYNNKPYSSSFIDSGSNVLYFLTTTETGLPLCTEALGFYCPTAQRSFTITNTGSNGASGTVTFNIANTQTLSSSGNKAFNNLGGSYSGGIDYGLPFFFGRNVYFAIKNQNTPGGVGPYYAY